MPSVPIVRSALCIQEKITLPALRDYAVQRELMGARLYLCKFQESCYPRPTGGSNFEVSICCLVELGIDDLGVDEILLLPKALCCSLASPCLGGDWVRAGSCKFSGMPAPSKEISKRWSAP